MSNFNNRVFGCVLVKSINSNYNADFSHQPRTLPNGIVYATDKALKYSVRNFLFQNESDKLFYFKNFNENLQPRTLDETFVSLFGAYPRKGQESEGFLFFKFEGGKLEGIIAQKPKKKKDVDDYFKKLEEDDSPLKIYKSDFNKVFDKKIKPVRPEIALRLLQSEKGLFDKEAEGVPVYFFVEDGKKILKVEGESEEIEEVANQFGDLDKIGILQKLLSCIDVRLFGATFAGITNISIHGPVQINHGVNIWKENNIFSEQISSPFRNPGEKSANKEATTLGRQSKLEEGHYIHHFSVNPKNLNSLVKLAGPDTQSLSDEDITKLKTALRFGVTYYDSAAKAGTDNEALVWVQLKEDSKRVLPNFSQLVKMDKKNGKVTYDLGGLKTVLADNDSEIEAVEIYYLKESVALENVPTEKTKKHDLTSGNEIQ